MKNNPLPTAAAPVVELATLAHEGTPRYGDYGHPSTEPAPVLPPDRRAEGGNVFDLRNEQTTL
jgi:hypothetical protein